MRASLGVIISNEWAKGNVTSYGSRREIQLSSLRKKLHEHKNSHQVHEEDINILETAKKDVLLDLHAKNEQIGFHSTAGVFWSEEDYCHIDVMNELKCMQNMIETEQNVTL